MAGRFADEAWLAELARRRESAQVAVVVAALGVREQPGVPPAGVLARRQLLVLDNCEHVIGAVAELCAGCWVPVMMCGCWRGAAGGRRHPMALFIDLARQADARFALDGETGPVVARLDGIPLAIELAGTGWRRSGTGRWQQPRGGATGCWARRSGGVPGGVGVYISRVRAGKRPGNRRDAVTLDPPAPGHLLFRPSMCPCENVRHGRTRVPLRPRRGLCVVLRATPHRRASADR